MIIEVDISFWHVETLFTRVNKNIWLNIIALSDISYIIAQWRQLMCIYLMIKEQCILYIQ